MSAKFSTVFLGFFHNELFQLTLPNLTRETLISEIITKLAQLANVDSFALFWTTDNRNFYYLLPYRHLGHYMINKRPKLLIMDIAGDLSSGRAKANIHNMPTFIPTVASPRRNNILSSNVANGNVVSSNVANGNVTNGNVVSSNVLSSDVASSNVLSSDVANDNVASSNVASSNVKDGDVKNNKSESWQTDLHIPTDFTFSIANLICARFSGTYQDFIQKLHTCAPVAQKVANSMIRVAATRIFANPYQSIIELPVNSIDSYRRMRDVDMPSVGKFGMGFFSILYWLIDQPQRHLIIYSKVAGQPAWILDIAYENNDFRATFKDASYATEINNAFQQQYDTAQLPGQSGTFVFLLNMHTTAQWQLNDFIAFNDQLQRLRYITDVKLDYLYINADSFSHTDLNTTSSQDSTSIAYLVKTPQSSSAQIAESVSGYKIGDYAQGISLDVLFSSLLVPSISTKTIERAQRTIDPYYQDQTGLHKADVDNFVITVGNIVVYASNDESTNNSKIVAAYDRRTAQKYVYRLDYPIYARLPVARDDVVVEYHSPEYDIMSQGLHRLVDVSIEANADVAQLFDYLRSYVNYSSQSAVNYLVQASINYALTKPNVIYLPARDVVELLQEADVSSSSYKLTYLRGASLSRANKQLQNYLATLAHITVDYTFQDITVVVLPGDIEPSSAGMPSFLFISRSLYEQTNWVYKLTLSYTNVILQPRDEEPLILLQRYEDAHNNLGISNYYVPASSGILHEATIRAIALSQVNQLALTIQTKYERLNMNRKYLFLIWKAIENVAFIDMNSVDEFMAQMNLFIANFKINPVEAKSSKIMFRTLDDLMYFNHQVLANYYTAYDDRPIIRQQYHDMVVQIINAISSTSKSKLVDAYTNTLWNNTDEDYFLRRRSINIIDQRSSPLHIAAVLYNEHGKIQFYQYVYTICVHIINNMQDAYEGTLLLKTFLLATAQGISTAKIYKIAVANYLLHEVRYRYDSKFMHDWQLQYPNSFSYEQKYWQSFFRPMIEALKLYSEQGELAFANYQSAIPSQPNYRFSANQLLDYVFVAAIDNIAADTTHKQLYKLLQQVSQHSYEQQSDRPQFQSVSIAVNEGTTKPFASSILTELLQNSIDAIRTNISQVKQRIDINMLRINNRLEISVQDYVGIPDNALLSLWIPFLSTKSAEDLMSTGEMGTGFFNVYRQPYTEMVVIRSDDLIIVARPIINNARVVDIMYEVTTGNRQVGSKITIHTHELSVEQRINLTIDVGLYVNGVAGLTAFDLYYGTKLVRVPTQLIYQEEVGSVYVMEERQTLSYIMTNGVPMMEMMPYLEKVFGKLRHYMVNMGFIIDIRKGYYQPVHSRSRLREVGYVLMNFLTRSLFYMITYKLGVVLGQKDEEIEYEIPDGIFNHYLSQGSSGSDLSQLQNYTGGYRKLVANIYYPRYNFNFSAEKCTLAYVIRQIIKKLDKDEIDIVRIRQILLDLHVPQLSIIRPVIERWFRDKQAHTTPVSADNTAARNNLDYDAQAPELQQLQQIFTNFVQHYYAIGQALNIKELKFPAVAPQIMIDEISDNILAFYSKYNHAIIINGKDLYQQRHGLINSWHEIRRLYQAGKIAHLTSYLYTSSMAEYIGNIVPAATLIHELQHSILNTSHDLRESHPQQVINGQIYDFSAGATYLYTKILQAGLWQRIFAQ